MTTQHDTARAPPVNGAATHNHKNSKHKRRKKAMYNNFMKHDFKNYYAPDGKGGYKAVKRDECFAYDDKSFIGKFPQQWYWDVQADFAVRLERNATGKNIYNEARVERRRAVRAYLEQFGCVRNACLKCKGWDEMDGGESKCDSCTKHVTFIALDEELDNDDGEKAVLLELASGADVEHQIETSELLKTLHKVLRTLGDDDRVLWRFLVADTKRQVIADHFGWTLSKLAFRRVKLYTILRSNDTLKNFFEKI